MSFTISVGINETTKSDKYFFRADKNILTIGLFSHVGSFNVTNFFREPSILIGRFCSIATNINLLLSANHSYKNVSTFPFDVDRIVKNVFDNVKPIPHIRPNNHYQIIIGHDVWIGQGATILGGVKIGNGAVIGAGAVVAKDIPPYAIAVGNPVRVIKYRFDEATIKKLLAVKWWNWNLEKIADNFPLMNDVEKFLDTHYSPALENFPKDEFTQMLNNFAGGGEFTTLLPTSAPLSRCG